MVTPTADHEQGTFPVGLNFSIKEFPQLDILTQTVPSCEIYEFFNS
jgi:hypothetical protein